MYFTNKSGGIGPCRGLTSFEKHHCIAFFFSLYVWIICAFGSRHFMGALSFACDRV